MVRLLIFAALLAAGHAFADNGGRHELAVDVLFDVTHGSSDYGAWTVGEYGKLRSGDGTSIGATRVFVEYRGRLAPTLSTHVLADYVNDASPGIDLTEAYLQWRPVPTSPFRQQWRFGAFYPPLSLENGERGWQSPYTASFSAANSWLGEEVRPLGLEWSFRRRVHPGGAPHEIGGFAGGFYANDPAGTLLFWRGFAVHDRQSRLGDTLPLAPAPIFGAGGTVTGYAEQHLEPFTEIDGRPGFYGGIEWRYARRAMLRVGHWDNRADPQAFAHGHWGWRTRFSMIAAQLELAGDLGLVAQWLSGDTRWLIATTPTGQRTPATALVRDEIDTRFMLLTKAFGDVHRLTLRYDDFDYSRAPDETIDSGHAWTLAYRHDAGGRAAITLEGLRIDSGRDPWTEFYGLPRRASEWRLRLQLLLRFRP